jgi:hypothetical protein
MIWRGNGLMARNARRNRALQRITYRSGKSRAEPAENASNQRKQKIFEHNFVTRISLVQREMRAT